MNRITFFRTCLLAVLLVGVAFATHGAEKLKVLVVTGGHGFEKEPFYKLFSDNQNIAVTQAAHASKTNANVFERDDLLTYDVVVLYDMPSSITEAQKAKFMGLFQKGTGLVVLHHALVSYQHWPEYERIIGGRYPEEDGKGGKVTAELGYKHDEEVPVIIVAKNHPITKGVKEFAIHDEIYWGFRVGADVTPLLTTTHPQSGKPLAWVRSEGKSRVAYLQLGHDHSAYENPNYRTLVSQAIQWAARRK